ARSLAFCRSVRTGSGEGGQRGNLLDEFTFRFNRRSSRFRGLLFYRLGVGGMKQIPGPGEAPGYGRCGRGGPVVIPGGGRGIEHDVRRRRYILHMIEPAMDVSTRA
ncbi:MAG TPA: hypothetical protein VE173_01235, partial [Longimicrobiales bacterium]|nr:hypothetical protein [Longimicrobiales bacterium]